MPGAGGVAQRRAEAEGEAHHQLRPPGDPLGQRIQRHQQQRRHAQRLRQTVQLQQDRQPDQQQDGQEHQRLPRAQHSGGQRPTGGARHHSVDVAIPEVVHHAAGGPHHQAADPEQQDQPDRLGRRRAGEQNAPQPRQEQQPDADRPIDPRQQQIGQPGARQPATQPVATMSVCACIAATLPVGMTGSIRLYVTAPLTAGESVAGVRRAGALSRQRHAPRRRRYGPPVQRPRRRIQRRASKPCGVTAPRCASSSNSVRRPQEPDVWLLFALLKRDATDLVVRAGDRTGCRRTCYPVITERSNTHRMNADRLSAIAIEAAEQCERLTVPGCTRSTA